MQMKAPKPIARLTAEVTQDWTERKSRLDSDGKIAVDRLLLYLRRLNYPEPQALGLALRAIREAEGNSSAGSQGNPVAEAMQALLRLLPEDPAAGQNHFLNGRCEPPRASQPLVRRLPMVPQELSPTKTLRPLSATRRTATRAKRAKHGAKAPA